MTGGQGDLVTGRRGTGCRLPGAERINKIQNHESAEGKFRVRYAALALSQFLPMPFGFPGSRLAPRKAGLGRDDAS